MIIVVIMMMIIGRPAAWPGHSVGGPRAWRARTGPRRPDGGGAVRCPPGDAAPCVVGGTDATHSRRRNTARDGIAAVFAWKGETLEEYWKCTLAAVVWPDDDEKRHGPDIGHHRGRRGGGA